MLSHTLRKPVLSAAARPLVATPVFFVQLRGIQSKVTTAQEAVDKHIRSNQTVLCGGFGVCGIPETYFKEIAGRQGIENLTCVSNNAGVRGLGLDKLLAAGQISKMIMSFIGGNKDLEKAYKTGKVEIELTPQGTIAERCRAASAGAPAFYTATGVNTWVEEGKMPVKYDENGNVIKFSEPKETREFNGRRFLLEHALDADVALVKCWKADKLGNLTFRGTAFNFNEIMAKAAKVTLVEADEIVEVGEIPPEAIDVPGVHVQAVIQSLEPKEVESEITMEDMEATAQTAGKTRLNIARRAAKEFKDGDVINLGIGLPTLASNFIEPGIHVTLHSENGILGMGPFPRRGEVDYDITNAGKESITLLPGAAVFDSEQSFSMVRSGKIDTTILGAIEVSEFGDLANWGVAGNAKGMGGAMDLVSNRDQTRVIVCTVHNAKDGTPKIVKECVNPLTGAKVASRIITDKAVFDVDPVEGLTLIEIQPGATLEDIRATTGAPFKEAL